MKGSIEMWRVPQKYIYKIDVPARRRMRCGWCGYETVSYGIGAMFCGPHRTPDGYYYPAKQMHEMDDSHYERAWLEMKIEKLPLRSGYMLLPLVNPDGFGYWHPDYVWYMWHTRADIYVRPGSGEMLTLKMRLVGDMPLPMVNPTGAGGFG
ncbi:MAG: hypothetical protein MN733_09365, partial [Nitrososphaera sp.]|nr:hypothetical protein [Nitrososphaera sp.]